MLGADRGAASYPSDLRMANALIMSLVVEGLRPKCQDVPKTPSDFEATTDVSDLSTARHRDFDVCVVRRGFQGHGSGPSVACRPFSEPSSRTGAAPELARRQTDRGATDFCSRRGRRRGSAATGACRPWRSIPSLSALHGPGRRVVAMGLPGKPGEVVTRAK